MSTTRCAPYAAKPDGEDCFNKTVYCMKLGGKIGAYIAVCDVLLISKPKGYMPTLVRIIASGSPTVLAGATFATMACAMTNIRKKDDHLNYFIAGASAGAVLGSAIKKPKLAIGFGIAGGLLSILLKDSLMNNWSLFRSTMSSDREIFNKTLYRNPNPE